ncbi:TIGR03087 family PEP-CTERM/XrtA system glycosyltransferase [Novosphingobium sp. YJ-S2-02]|uniref:TIGR03087 family PEP-CTERM/XrtA system glycosyltransferase n=1 Tax=Novosphingobium aureum TaxID=2792964 RepID=A0A931MKK3_9SPHN|nr:TIGR03087 family PEP-CTERM/XrtA system glycosyltransferase [Novosphingobium aureum]MBH0113017.1 TIGR03087 family PEP-CTERM/XrtA system glycosyltransferase [Novosphingobium aureum]
MSEILFLAHRIPFPPDRGDKIRSHHVLKALARLAPVHVATFADEPEDMAQEAELATLAASHCLVERRKPLAIAGLEALARREPVSLAAFRDRALASYVAKVLTERPISAIYVFSGQMAQYVPKTFTGHVVADLVDVDSAKFEAYGASGKGPRAWIERREGRMLSRVEQAVVERSDTTLLISDEECELLRSRLLSGVSARDVHAMGNGIDAALFDPALVAANPAMAAMPGPRVIFTGQMDYAPNIAAAERAIRAIMPRVREIFPDASFHVVGRNPPESLRAFDGSGGVKVWGRVPDIRPFLAGADLALVPLEIARGVQNKVLEAMAMGLPVVLSPGAATGIAARDGRDFAIAESDADLVQALISLARDREAARAMAVSARGWILANASWPAALARLPEFCGLAQGREHIDAA